MTPRSPRPRDLQVRRSGLGPAPGAPVHRLLTACLLATGLLGTAGCVLEKDGPAGLDAGQDGACDARMGPVDASADATPAAADTRTAGAPQRICPGPEAPGPETRVGDVPQPDTCGCVHEAPAFFKGATPPPEALSLEVGVVDSTGTFQPYKDGSWVPMVHGLQGGFHVYVAVRLRLPGQTVPKAKIQLETLLFDGCKQTGQGLAPVVYPELQEDGAYVLGNAKMPGKELRFFVDEEGVKSAVSADFCNRWFDLRVAVRDVKSGQWGHKKVQVRTYDTIAH